MTVTKGGVALAVGSVLLAGLGSAVAVGLSSPAGGHHPGSGASYCDAARAVDDYHGHRAATLAALLDRVAQVAPVDIASEVRTMRASRAHGARYDAAERVWSRYNTNHCCTCIGGPNAPVIATTTPP